MQDPKTKQVDNWDEEVVDVKPTQVSDWGEDVVDAPIQKKSEVGNESTKPLQQGTEGSAMGSTESTEVDFGAVTGTPTPEGRQLQDVEIVATKDPYKVDGKKVKAPDLTKMLYEPSFIDALQSGKTTVEFPENDEAMKYLVERQKNAGSRTFDVWNSLKAGTEDMLAGVVGLDSYVANVMRSIPGLENAPKTPQEIVSELGADNLRMRAEKEREKIRAYEDGFINEVKSGNYGNASSMVFNTLAESTPFMVGVGATMGEGILPMLATNIPVTASKEFAKDVDGLNNREKVLRAAVYGGSEVGFGTLPTVGIFAKNFAIGRGLIRDAVGKALEVGGEDAAKRVATDVAKKTTLESLKALGIDASLEVGGELLTTLSQMGVDDALGVTNYTPEDYQKQLLETAAISLAMTGVMTSPSIKRIVDSSIKFDKGATIKGAVFDAVEKGVMDAAQAKNVMDAIAPRIESVNNLPADVVVNTETVDTVAEIKRLESEKEKADEIGKAFIDAEINVLEKGVAIPLPNKYVNTAGKNTSELKDGQLYITRKGDVRMWDAAQEQFLEAPKTTQVKLGTEVELEPTVTETKQEPTKEVVTSIESTREPIVSKKEEKIDTKAEKETNIKEQPKEATPNVEVVTPKVDNGEAAVVETPKVEEVVAEDVAPTETVATEPAHKVNVGSVTYKENSPAQLQGRERTIPIADGTKIKGRYKIVSADDVLASHNEESFAKTENFPTTEDGKTVNDRDYETDKAAQSEVVRIASKLDSRAVSQTPIVTKDGIVVDGNNRTMSRKLAAKQGTDAEYLAALQADADMYGIDAEQISGVKNPMLVFEAEQEIPYTTKEFARFNKSEKKEKSPIEKAVELSKTVSDKARRVLGDIYEGVDTPSEITSNSKNMAKVRDLLVSEGIIQQNELPRYINPETGTATKEGVSFLETLMMGSALNESTIRMLDNEGMGNAKSIVLKSVVQITKNAALGDNSLQPNIENGIKLLNKANQSKQSVVDAISQMDMFEVSQFSAEDLAVAILLDGKGFNDFLKRYNSEVGTESLFEGKLTKEKLIDSLLSQRIKNYEQVRKNIRTAAEGGQAEVQQGDGGVGKESEATKSESTKEPTAKKELTKIELAKQKLQEAKAKAKAVRDSKSNLGAVSDPFEDAKKQAETDREVFDAYVSLGKEYVKAGIKTVEDFAKEIGEELTDTLRNAWDVANGGKKKTLVTERAYEGQFREDVKKELEKIGLTREVASQSEAEKKAADIISTVGVDAALEAVRSGDVKNGDVEAAIYFLSIEELGKQIDKSNDEVEIAALVSKQASILNELGEQQTRAGQFSAIASRFYAESDLGYNSKVQEKKWENQFGEKPSEELMQKWKERDKEFAELDKKLKEAEKRALEAEEKAAMQNIKQSVDNEVVRERKQAQGIYGKTRIAKGLDDLASALGARLSAVGDERAKVSKALADIGQGLIEEGIATARNVGKKLREYLDANFAGKINFDEYEADVISSITGVSTQGGLKVPHSLIRKFVKDGIDNIDDLTTAVHEVVSKSDPSITERQVRDAITGYGKVAHPTKDAIEADIRKMKRVGRIVSALEDIKNKKRPLRSGKQRDAIDAEERRLGKELREAMKDLPADDETKANELRTRLDATKKRVQNQIEDYEGEIERMEALPKNPKITQEDAELKELRQKRDELKKERDELFKDEEAFERQRLELAKKRAQQRIEDYQRRLKEGDFSKKEVKPVIADDELTKLKAEKLRLKDEYDKEFYKEELRSRTKWEKQKDVLWELWNVPRVLMATGEWSFIGIQGIKQSIAHPTHAVKAFKNAWTSMKSEAKTEQFLREIKSQEWYPTLKESKLALTEPNAKLTAREELFYSGWTNTIWDMVGMAVMSPAKFKGEGAFENAMKAWSNANPIKATERAAVGYLDTIRVLRFLDGMQILEMQGKDFASNKEDYKDVADAINTMTGRASLGALDANAELLSKLFFSPRNWASGIKTATPYALAHFGKMTPTARKMAIADLSKFLGVTTGMVMMVAAQLNNDDDEETSVELDPRSTDFMKIKLGNKRVDPWGGMQQQVVLSSRIIADAIMKGFALAGKESPIEGAIKKDGKLMPLGVPYKTKAAFDLLLQQATNKLNPTASLLYNFAKTKTNKEGAVVDEYGNDYTVSDQLGDKFYPIFWGTAYDLLKDDPSALNGLLTFYAFFGGGVLNYENKKKDKSNSRGDQRSSTRGSDQRSSKRK